MSTSRGRRLGAASTVKGDEGAEPRKGAFGVASRRSGALAVLPLVAGCVYFNALYNAERLYDEAEGLRRAGGEAQATERYVQVVEKARRSYERDVDGRWADDALYLIGRAYLRQGRLLPARKALEQALEISTDDRIRSGATLYLGVVASLSGDTEGGIHLLNDAIRRLGPGAARAEGHLWRARVLLSAGEVDAGWWDLQRAEEEHTRLRVSADLERLAWAVAHGDRERARAGARGLLTLGEAAVLADSVRALVTVAGRSWGPGAAASLLEGAEDASWPAAERDGALLLRASFHAQAGDLAAAAEDAGRVARGAGAAATRARLWLAGLELSRAETIADLARVRPILLPAVGTPGVLELLVALRKAELLEQRARGEPESIALFAAAELARDELGAPRLAVALFVRYADLDAASPWAGKALLAALALGPGGANREALRRRVDSYASDTYVRAARGVAVSAAEYERLEGTLQQALASVMEEVTAQAEERDVQARDRSSPSAPGG